MTQYTKAEVLLEVSDIQLAYGGRQILRDINFVIQDIQRPGMQQGQVVSLIGRSGIGKTQLFKILAGLQTPQQGRVIINGDKMVSAGDMGVVFQHYYLFEWRTVYQSLLLAARQNKQLKGREQEEIQHYASAFNLTEELQKYPQQLSGGQRQRVSIIQQLLKGSDFLLLDEPFSGLDVCMLQRVTDLLLQVSTSSERKTLLIVSHDILTSAAISDTVLILGQQTDKPGATIVREIDLISEGLAWRKDIHRDPAFLQVVEEIKQCL